jgi:excisionase family DNA binding protein
MTMQHARVADTVKTFGPVELVNLGVWLGAHRIPRKRKAPTPARMPQGFYTPEDIAAYMGMSTYTVQDLCRRGELRHVKAGRSIRIRREWADAFMAAREREPLR